MTQYFLLSGKARTLSLRRVFEMNEEQAFKVFKKVRWGDSKAVTCPTCGVVGEHYFIATRRQWRCKDCHHTFSVTSGTIFAFHKLPLKMYLAAIAIYTNAAKGISALQMGRDLDVQKGSVICADESNAYDGLHAKFDTRRVNHALEYRSDAGITNNLAESYFSRFRRMQYGQAHE